MEKIKDMQKELVILKEHKHQWNIFMQRKYESNEINISSMPTVKAYVFADTSGGVVKENMKSEKMSRHNQQRKRKRQRMPRHRL